MEKAGTSFVPGRCRWLGAGNEEGGAGGKCLGRAMVVGMDPQLATAYVVASNQLSGFLCLALVF